jgi:hypothetical protein
MVYIKGAIAEPLANTIIIPKKSRTMITGNSHHFFRSFKKLHKSPTSDIT